MAQSIATDELRKLVWDALVEAGGNREEAAAILGKSVRSLNRYIHDLNLFSDMDRAGMIKHRGPPRNEERGTSVRQVQIFQYIKSHRGQIDYGELATEMYAADNERTRQRVYSALNELKGKGLIAEDGIRWWIV